MKSKIEKLLMKGVVETCPVCGYTDGFHVSFHVNGSDKKIILICPDCHKRFNPEWSL